MTQLVQGKIPAFTDCPYRSQCTMDLHNQCKQTGVTHPVPFSCGMARAIALVTTKA
jgi:hypothetical protein